jgi:hypothetical protein
MVVATAPNISLTCQRLHHPRHFLFNHRVFTFRQEVASYMKLFSRIFLVAQVLFLSLLLVGCNPEVGSEQWCNNLKEKPKGDWTANEAKDFAKHCILK